MKPTLNVLTVFLFGLGMAQSVNALTLTFDDLPTTTIATITNGYGGLNWNDMGYLDSTSYSGGTSGYKGGTVSGDYVAFTDLYNLNKIRRFFWTC